MDEIKLYIKYDDILNKNKHIFLIDLAEYIEYEALWKCITNYVSEKK